MEELQSLQSKQIKEKKLDKAHEPSEKDVSALSPKIVQNWENDDEGISQVVESEKDYEIEMSTRIQSKDTIAQTQSDVLQRRIEAENSKVCLFKIWESADDLRSYFGRICKQSLVFLSARGIPERFYI